MMKAPERIWVWDDEGRDCVTHPGYPYPASAIEYVRATDYDALAAKLAKFEAERDAMRTCLKRWQETGCPDCQGDCASANPPVVSCIMQQTSEALK